MPFESDKQRRFMYAKHPGIARRWSEEAKEEGVPATKHKKKRKWLKRKAKEVEKGMDLVDIHKAYASSVRSLAPRGRAGVPVLPPKYAFQGKPLSEEVANRKRTGRLAALHMASGDQAGAKTLINQGKRMKGAGLRGSIYPKPY